MKGAFFIVSVSTIILAIKLTLFPPNKLPAEAISTNKFEQKASKKENTYLVSMTGIT